MEKFTLTLLDPLFYNSSFDSGASGGTVTFPFIGDIALNFAISYSLGIGNPRFLYNSHKPQYEAMKEFGFFTSVAMSAKNVRTTRIYDFATSIMSDGYPDVDLFKKMARAPFRNWIKKQGLAPGNKFEFYLFTKQDKNIDFPHSFTVRLGNMRSCLSIIEKTETNDKDLIWINLFSLWLITRNEGLDNEGVITKYSDIYTIQKGISVRRFREALRDYS